MKGGRGGEKKQKKATCSIAAKEGRENTEL